MDSNSAMLGTKSHERDSAGLTYVYPVLSRRAAGVSVGINLNPNNACNWRCVYCQVPDLVRGAAPPIDLGRLEAELAGFLSPAALADFMRTRVPAELRALRDIAFSGNGEPTSARGFERIVRRVGEIRGRCGLGNEVPLRLITNGSLISRAEVLAGLQALAEFGGEVWFKVDAVEPDDVARINGAARSPARTLRDLGRCAMACPTWVQTCMFRWDGKGPDDAQLQRYERLIEAAGAMGVRGVLLYGVARQSMQPERVRIAALDRRELEEIAERIRKKGLTVSVSP